MKNIANSMQSEFERRAYYALSKEECTKGIAETTAKRNIHNQTERILAFNIKDEDSAIQFIRLSFEYPVLQAETLDESLENELSESQEESEKIEILTNYLLNIEYYGNKQRNYITLRAK